MKNPNRKENNKLIGNRIPMIAIVLMICWFFVPFLPRLITVVIPFPTLQEATYLEGTFDFEGEWPQVRVPRYFVVNAQGRHEFQCGYLGGRHSCFFKPSAFKGQPIKVWTNFWYGRVQHEATMNPGMRPYPLDSPTRTYLESRSVYLDPAYVAVKDFNPISPILLLLLLFWLVAKEVWNKRN